jgi:Actinobacteria/chloroflexi VLRF1 release factor
VGGANPVVSVRVPAGRLERWITNFADRHGEVTLAVHLGCFHGSGADGSTFTATLPFATPYGGDASAANFTASVRVPQDWGVLLVRKGGFAIARLNGNNLVASKVGQRHVQGRTAAGGQSQQRFARRRDNQARQAFQAAADYAVTLLAGLDQVVAGGDRTAVDEVLRDPRLTGLALIDPWLPVPDPRRAVLDQAIRDAQCVAITVSNI